ncbi:hypothetical protein DPMN_093760 [Dreissena polymorpha]|uniref:Uncharacterized protein n=1 Tax=Dreissena polymorpha TaxID=45954 RepID=A0A9D4R2V6_DREPO|nr:hypothetical protein DPMN_093760 [Dreissena polymorpha]
MWIWLPGNHIEGWRSYFLLPEMTESDSELHSWFQSLSAIGVTFLYKWVMRSESSSNIGGVILKKL